MSCTLLTPLPYFFFFLAAFFFAMDSLTPFRRGYQ
jgi:hypothetical protein